MTCWLVTFNDVLMHIAKMSPEELNWFIFISSAWVLTLPHPCLHTLPLFSTIAMTGRVTIIFSMIIFLWLVVKWNISSFIYCSFAFLFFFEKIISCLLQEVVSILGSDCWRQNLSWLYPPLINSVTLGFYLISWYFSFLICKVSYVHRLVERVKWMNIYETFKIIYAK